MKKFILNYYHWLNTQNSMNLIITLMLMNKDYIKHLI